MFRRLNIKDWRQISEIDIEFHRNLTIITGANGAGKTTILNLLSQATGWNSKFVSNYNQDEDGTAQYRSGLFNEIEKSFIEESEDNPVNSINKLGELEFSDGKISALHAPKNITTGTYSVTISGKPQVDGVYINSHRPTFPYKAVKAIPTVISTREQIYKKYYDFSKTFVFDTFRNSTEISATTLIKETLASLAIFGYGNQAVSKNESAKKLFEGYIEILKVVLPPKLEFETINVVMPEVILCTKTGDFPIDAVSGGISSIIDITWQLYMFADKNEKFVALLDEPENHLHPELQKSFLGNLIAAFPNVQFIVATHNPFMISSQKDSNVYVLNYNECSQVFSQKLDYINRAGTSNAILRDVLGIDTTIPAWAEVSLEKIVQEYSSKEFNSDVLKELKNQLSSIGMSDYIPNTISKVVERKHMYD
ncbi:AAA family ATPase [Bengtsoniella intestinalis]|uniref:AAA family ATPase n=1 Tax=Bengtsoniella intestinalis TaxID=3073143 RepID=UPI00391F4A60